MRTVAVIQARLNSTRLPRKILLPLAGKSMLQNIIERVKRAKRLDGVVVACPFLSDTDYETIADICAPKQNGQRIASLCYLFAPQVNENDLNGRLLKVAKLIDADYIIRICADNPCVEPAEIDNLVEHIQFLKSPCRELRISSEHPAQEFDGFGGELYTIEMLEWMDRVIKDPIYREHPHKIWVELGAYSYCGSMYPPGFRLDVNTEEEYQKLKTIYDHFGHNRFHVKEAVEYLDEQNRNYLHGGLSE